MLTLTAQLASAEQQASSWIARRLLSGRELKGRSEALGSALSSARGQPCLRSA